MATVNHPDKDKNGGGDGKFSLTDTQCGENFEFKLKRNYVKVQPKDWQTKLNESEKLQIFEAILKNYRKRSMGDGDMKLAAIGITMEGEIYIATNTERLSSPYFRQCAELNMVAAVTQDEVYKQLRANVSKTFEPKLSALYLLGGRDGDPVKRPLCPCGNCTDMLSRVMEPGAPLYMLPLERDEKVAPITEKATTLTGVDPGQAWKTTIATLNAHREINLARPAANAQKAGYKHLLKRGANMPEQQAKELTDRLMGAANDKAPGIHNVTELVGYLLNPKHLAEMPKELMHEANYALQCMLKSAENALTQKQSVAALDAATDAEGHPHLADLNRYMVNEIQRSFANRLGTKDFKNMDPGQIDAAVNEQIGAIRCVVIQLDDGTYRTAIEARSSLDNAQPSAEMSALAGATAYLGTQGVKDVWAMEMAPKDIARGSMHTSTKEGAERLLKRRSKGTEGVNFHFIPFNPGTATEDKAIADITKDISGEALFPSQFLGVKQAASMR